MPNTTLPSQGPRITTAGQLLIKSMLPTQAARDHHDLYKPLNKNAMKDLVNNLIEHGGPNGHETINDLSKVFFNKATEIGATTPLSDYVNDSDERQTMFSELETKVADILKSDKDAHAKKVAISLIGAEYGSRLSKQNLEYLLARGSTAARMANTGARGTPAQLQQGTASPLMAVDIKGNPIPVVIKHSFAEGLSGAEHLAMSYGGRASTVMSQLSTALPGALFKKLTPSVFHEVITTTDCGTKAGVPLDLTDKLSCIGRFEAGTNRLIDYQYWKELQNDGKTRVIARNPMTCQAKEGLCQKCYGLAANSKLPEIGFNAGVIAAQSVSEVLTQAMLSTKHQGGVVGRQRNPYEEASNLLNNPHDNFQDEATISETNGTVTHIRETALKDKEVFVDDKPHFVPRIQDVTVKVGDTLQIGDPLSSGTINPRRLTELKGPGAGRVMLANELRKVYSKNAQLDPRHFDIIARNMIKYVKVTDPGHSGFLPGDIVEMGQLQQHLSDNSKDVAIDSSLGKMLSKNSLELTPGTRLTQNHIDYLKQNGVSQVPISDTDLQIKAQVPGLHMNKLWDKSWISKLSFSRLADTIRDAGATGASSAIHSTEPITGYMMGTEFGEGTNGRY